MTSCTCKYLRYYLGDEMENLVSYMEKVDTDPVFDEFTGIDQKNQECRRKKICRLKSLWHELIDFYETEFHRKFSFHSRYLYEAVYWDGWIKAVCEFAIEDRYLFEEKVPFPHVPVRRHVQQMKDLRDPMACKAGDACKCAQGMREGFRCDGRCF